MICSNCIFAGEISLSFDDAPRKSSYFSGSMRSKKLAAGLAKANIARVAFFINTKKMNSEGLDRVRYYSSKGHLLGNHSHSHPDLNKVDLYDYIKDIRKAHELLKPIKGFGHWFRFPYLREGNTIEKRDRVREDLARLGYQNAYVTVNNYDWYMDILFQKAINAGKKINFDNLKKVYIKVLVESVKFYDNMAKSVLKRSPRHILLLHENDLAAMFISELADALRKIRWNIVSPEKSYKDDISTYKTSNLFNFNPGRIGEIAKDKGWKMSKLWHVACDEPYLEKLFISESVYQK